MSNIFSGSEVVEIAVQIERNGLDFYIGVIRLSKSQGARPLFEFLAGQEREHIKSFEGVLSEVKRYEPSEAYPGEYFAYLKALSEEHIFTKENKGKEIAESVKTEIEAIDLGLRFEDESIVFYEGMKKVVLESEGKVIDRLIGEEKMHAEKLRVMKKDLTS